VLSNLEKLYKHQIFDFRMDSCY